MILVASRRAVHNPYSGLTGLRATQTDSCSVLVLTCFLRPPELISKDWKKTPVESTMATKVALPEYQVTALDAIPGIANSARLAFRTHKTKNLKWRVTQLRKLYWAVEDYKLQLCQALMKDLRKGDYEALLTEVDWVKNDCLFMIDHLEKFAKDEKISAPYVPATFSMMKFRVRKDPGDCPHYRALQLPDPACTLPLGRSHRCRVHCCLETLGAHARHRSRSEGTHGEAA